MNDGLAKIVEQYVKTGAKLYVEGALQTRKWADKDGAERTTTEIVISGFAGTLTMLDGKSASDG